MAPASSSANLRRRDTTHPRFSDFATEEKPLDGKKMGVDAVLNKEILILDFRAGNRSQFKEGGLYTTIQFEIDSERHVLFTGSEVITDQLQRYKDHLPFVATIRKINKYYTLT